MTFFLPHLGRLARVLAVTTIAAGVAHAQDPSIDKLLKKLPPPEKLVKPSVTRALSRTDPAGRDPLVPQIEAALKSNNGARALDLLRKLMATYPKSAAANCLHGMIALLPQRYAEAAKALRESASLQPNFAPAYLGLAALEAAQRHYAAAIPHLKKLTALEPNYGFGWIALSDCALRSGRKQE